MRPHAHQLGWGPRKTVSPGNRPPYHKAISSEGLSWKLVGSAQLTCMSELMKICCACTWHDPKSTTAKVWNSISFSRTNPNWFPPLSNCTFCFRLQVVLSLKSACMLHMFQKHSQRAVKWQCTLSARSVHATVHATVHASRMLAGAAFPYNVIKKTI